MMGQCALFIFVVIQVFYVANVCRSYCGTVGQIYFEWFGCNTFVVNIRIVHDEYCCHASVSNCFICSNGQRVKIYCGIGVLNMVRAVAANEGRLCTAVLLVV